MDFQWQLPASAVSFDHCFLIVLRNKMVEYLTDWVMGTSNQAADDDIKCLTRYSLVASSALHWLQYWRHILFPACLCVIKGSWPGQYGGSCVSACWSSSATGGGRWSGANGGQITAFSQVRIHFLNFYLKGITPLWTHLLRAVFIRANHIFEHFDWST